MKDRKFLVCSDLHGSNKAIDIIVQLERSEPFSAVIVCGDITTCGSPPYVRKLLDSVNSELLAVPGNCDTPETLAALEKSGCSVHGRAKTVDGVAFFGFGGGLPSPSSMPFEVDEDEIVSGLQKAATERGVMVTHTPPRGMNDLDHTGRHAGSVGILDVVRKLRPRAVLSGHIHEARGIVREGGTLFINPGTARGGYYAILTIGQDVRAELS